MATYSNTNYTNDYFDTTGYFNPTSQSSSSIDIEDLDKRYLQKSGGTISNNLLVNGSVDIQTSLSIPNVGNVETELTALEGRLDTEEPKTSALQTLTATLSTNIASNTANILTKQDTITTSTYLNCNLMTTNHLEVNNIISTSQFF